MEDEIKFGKVMVMRLQQLVTKLVSASFFTWGIVLVLWSLGKITLDGTDFLLFTTGVIGIKSWKAVQDHKTDNKVN